jgi:hypothetical protein
MRNKIILAFALMTLFATAVSSQSAAVYGGLAVPTGNFGGTNLYRNALSSDYGDQGGATFGFNIGARYMRPFHDSKVNWFLSVDFFCNGYDSDLKDAIGTWAHYQLEQSIRKAQGNNTLKVEYFEIEYPYYYNIPFMAGINCPIFDLGQDCSFWIEVGLGANYRKLRDMRITFECNNEQFESKFSFDESLAFAYQIGAGLKFKDHFLIGAGLYNLGADIIKGKVISGDNWNESQTTENLITTMLCVRLGWIF